MGIKRVALGIATGVVSLCAAVAVSNTASASIGDGRIQLCVHGDYRADLTWHDASHTTAWRSTTVRPGQCQTFDAPGWASPTPTSGASRSLSLSGFGAYVEVCGGLYRRLVLAYAEGV